ncbi:hypothetical protein I308_103142 [Cryptococcus tetragattii IND107]|uniref:Ataxin-10 homolog n=1 Tax=Cryptococcus tetragattii IND107 TaxID=1296105 RepID=A0ABR3BSA8_9TREE|nr:hypothetical protein I308_04689 [Cryptococcus tetragattii IND107]
MKQLGALNPRLLANDLESDELCLEGASNCEGIARYLAGHLNERTDILESEEAEGFFQGLGQVWTPLATSFDPSAKDMSRYASEDSRIRLALGLAKMERNLVAGLLPFQSEAFKHEPDIRRFIFNITTFVRIEDSRFSAIHAIATQLLSNVLAPVNSSVAATRHADAALRIYMSGNREDDIIIRLLDSRDPKTNHATLHLLNNLTRNSLPRLEMLLTPTGIKWLAQLLGRMDEWLDKEDNCFDLTASIFTSIISFSLHPRIFQLLSEPSEPITPSQTVLLKILDSTLSSLPASSPSPPVENYPNSFLHPLFNNLIQSSLPSLTQKADDPRLPKYLEGLVLVSEALGTIGLRVQERIDKATAPGADREDVGPQMQGGEEQLVKVIKEPRSGIVRPLIDMLRALNDYFPRTNPRNPSPVTTTTAVPPELKPFSNLKRDLVRLLGVLTFSDTRVGDQVRECEGVQLVLSLTEIDEGNPFLREHALFCVRNLMLNNPANQAIIKEMDPIGVLSETGELLPVPEKMKKTSTEATITEEK